MNHNRKQMIITEIKYWKRNKLLPEHYCDFLITLYAGGEEERIPDEDSVLVKERKGNNKQLILLSIAAAVIFGTMFLLDSYPGWTLSLAAGLITLLLVVPAVRKVNSGALVATCYILAAFLLLGISLKVWMAFFDDQTMMLVGLLVMNCALWLFAGRMLKLLYFTISGAAGLLLVTGFIFMTMR